MTLLTTLIFNFHLVISALRTPATTPTLSVVKTSLKIHSNSNTKYLKTAGERKWRKYHSQCLT